MNTDENDWKTFSDYAKKSGYVGLRTSVAKCGIVMINLRLMVREFLLLLFIVVQGVNNLGVVIA